MTYTFNKHIAKGIVAGSLVLLGSGLNAKQLVDSAGVSVDAAGRSGTNAVTYGVNTGGVNGGNVTILPDGIKEMFQNNPDLFSGPNKQAEALCTIKRMDSRTYQYVNTQYTQVPWTFGFFTTEAPAKFPVFEGNTSYTQNATMWPESTGTNVLANVRSSGSNIYWQGKSYAYLANIDRVRNYQDKDNFNHWNFFNNATKGPVEVKVKTMPAPIVWLNLSLDQGFNLRQRINGLNEEFSLANLNGGQPLFDIESSGGQWVPGGEHRFLINEDVIHAPTLAAPVAIVNFFFEKDSSNRYRPSYRNFSHAIARGTGHNTGSFLVDNYTNNGGVWSTVTRGSGDYYPFLEDVYKYRFWNEGTYKSWLSGAADSRGSGSMAMFATTWGSPVKIKKRGWFDWVSREVNKEEFRTGYAPAPNKIVKGGRPRFNGRTFIKSAKIRKVDGIPTTTIDMTISPYYILDSNNIELLDTSIKFKKVAAMAVQSLWGTSGDRDLNRYYFARATIPVSATNSTNPWEVDLTCDLKPI